MVRAVSGSAAKLHRMIKGMLSENQQYLEQEYRQFELRGDKDRTIEKHLWRTVTFTAATRQ